MKHGRMIRTPASKPEWYRRWESSQMSETVYVIDNCIICRPETVSKLAKQADPAQFSVMPPLGGMKVIADPLLPPPKWMNRRDRKREKRERVRQQVRLAAEQIASDKKVYAVADIFDPNARYRVNSN